MKVLFDTNVLVAAIVADHPSYPVSFPWLQRVRAQSIVGCVSTHSLAELYSVLTRLPLPKPLTARQAHTVIANNLNIFEIIDLDSADYLAVLEDISKLGITGGGVYDALIAQAARKINAEVLLTLNPKHFIRLGERFVAIIRVPELG